MTMNRAQGAAAAVPGSTLHDMPVGLFGAVMGSVGLAVAWRLVSNGSDTR